MKKILIVDWLDKYGGAERVLTVLNKQFDFYKCFTLINIMSNSDLNRVFNGKKIKIVESNLRLVRSGFRYLFFLFPFFISRFKSDDTNALIISSSFSVAKGFKKQSNQTHICYYQARNQRYIWDTENIYFSWWQRIILAPLLFLLRKIDITWIEGNHDSNLLFKNQLIGNFKNFHKLRNFKFVHSKSKINEVNIFEFSGHYHPKINLKFNGLNYSYKCFVLTENFCILPSFGTYTGGLDIKSNTIQKILPTNKQIIILGNNIYTLAHILLHKTFLNFKNYLFCHDGVKQRIFLS